MNANDFKEGSIERVLFEYWNGDLDDAQAFELLSIKDPLNLSNFIMTCQSKGRFGAGYIHP